MIRKSMILMVLFVGIFMLVEYHARGYFAIGAEILIVPMWIIGTYECWKEVQRKRAILSGRKGE